MPFLPAPPTPKLFTTGKTPEQVRFFEQQAALGRLGKPTEIADVVAFLASDAAG